MAYGNCFPSSSRAFSQSSGFLYSTNAYFSPSSVLGGGMSRRTSSPYLELVSLDRMKRRIRNEVQGGKGMGNQN